MLTLKKHKILTAFLVAASLASYIYLNTGATNATATMNGQEQTFLEAEVAQLEEESEIVLPDISLVKKVFEIARPFLVRF